LERKIGDLENVVRDAEADFEEVSKVYHEKKDRFESIKEEVECTRYEILKARHPNPAPPKYKTIEDHPDREELLKLKALIGYRTRAEAILTPVCEGILMLEGYEFDIEMPTSPWYVGHLVIKDGEYHFTKDHVWRLDTQDEDHFREDIEGKIVLTNDQYEFTEEEFLPLEVFYGRKEREDIPEELLSGGKHKE